SSAYVALQIWATEIDHLMGSLAFRCPQLLTAHPMIASTKAANISKSAPNWNPSAKNDGSAAIPNAPKMVPITVAIIPHHVFDCVFFLAIMLLFFLLVITAPIASVTASICLP